MIITGCAKIVPCKHHRDLLGTRHIVVNAFRITMVFDCAVITSNALCHIPRDIASGHNFTGAVGVCVGCFYTLFECEFEVYAKVEQIKVLCLQHVIFQSFNCVSITDTCQIAVIILYFGFYGVNVIS